MRQNKWKTMLSRSNYFFSVVKARLLRKTEPVICVLVATNKCNLNCRYCFGRYSQRRGPDYSTAELKDLISRLYAMGTRYLNIHGGEVLLREDIGEIVRYIKDRGMYCCLITNGILLPKRINEIKQVDNLTISLDGTQENNDQNRNRGSFDRALEAIRLAKRQEVPLRVSATLTKYTMNDIGYLANLAKEMKFSLYFSILFKPLPQAKDCEMTDSEIRQTLGEIIEYKKKGFPIFTSFQAAEYAKNWPFDHNERHFLTIQELPQLPKDFKIIPCYYGKLKFTIEADGYVYPCFLLADSDKFKPLNWRDVGIERAIEHVRKTNNCVTCPALTQNDHNLLLGLDIRQIKHVILDQIREGFGRK